MREMISIGVMAWFLATVELEVWLMLRPCFRFGVAARSGLKFRVGSRVRAGVTVDWK